MTTDKLCMCKHALIIEVYTLYTRCSFHFNLIYSVCISYSLSHTSLPMQYGKSDDKCHISDRHTQPSTPNNDKIHAELCTSRSSWSSTGSLNGATSNGDHWMGMHLHIHEEKRGKKKNQKKSHTRYTSMLIFGVNNHVYHVY